MERFEAGAMIGLVLVVLTGLFVIDVLLEVWCSITDARRRRESERDRAAMRRALRRSGDLRR